MDQDFASSRAMRFVEEYLVDGNGSSAAIRAGYSPRSAHVTACRLLRKAKVRAALAARQAEIEAGLELDRQKVIGRILEAIDIARQKADPAAMIAGWREIARICGYYEPERQKIEITATVKDLAYRMERMSDAELLKIVQAPANGEH